MASLLIALLIFCLVVWLAYYIINNVLPEPMRKVATVILVVLVVIVLIGYVSQGGLGNFSMGRIGGPCR